MIKRELYRKKYFIVQREQGKVVSRVKWSPKSFTLNDAKRNFKQSGHIKRLVFRKVRTNVIETTDYSKDAGKRKKFRLKQFVATIFNKGRPTEITVRSIAKEQNAKFTNSEKQRVLDTALRNIGARFGTNSSVMEGLKVLRENTSVKIRRGFVFVTTR